MVSDKLTERQEKLMVVFGQEIHRVFSDVNPIALKAMMRKAAERYEQQAEFTVKQLEELEDLKQRLGEVKKMGSIFCNLLVQDFGMDLEKVSQSLEKVYDLYWKTVTETKK